MRKFVPFLLTGAVTRNDAAKIIWWFRWTRVTGKTNKNHTWDPWATGELLQYIRDSVANSGFSADRPADRRPR